MRYHPLEVALDPAQENKLKSAIQLSKKITLRVYPDQGEKKVLLFTKGQLEKIERSRLMGKPVVSIAFTPTQLKANTEQVGGFI